MKSWALFLVLAVAVGISIFFTYDRTIVQKNFEAFDSEAVSEEELIEEGAEIGDSMETEASDSMEVVEETGS